MTISELMVALQELLPKQGDIEVRVHCGNCCPHAHEIESIAIGKRSDERDLVVIEV